MWRFIVLTLTAFSAGFMQSFFQLRTHLDWQIPLVVGLAVFLAMGGARRRSRVRAVRKAVGHMAAAATGEKEVLRPSLDLNFVEAATVTPGETAPSSYWQELSAELPRLVAARRQKRQAELHVWVIGSEECNPLDMHRLALELADAVPLDFKVSCVITAPLEERARELVPERISQQALELLPAHLKVDRYEMTGPDEATLSGEIRQFFSCLRLDPLQVDYAFAAKMDVIVSDGLFADLPATQRVPLARRLARWLVPEGILATDARSARLLRPPYWLAIGSGLFRGGAPDKDLPLSAGGPSAGSQPPMIQQ